jgi:hypothetical protein
VAEGPEGYYIQPLPSTPDGSISVGFEDDIVSEISGQVAFYYPVGTMVEQLGGPEGIYTLKARAPVSSCEEWTALAPTTATGGSYPAYILSPSKGLAFLVLVPWSGSGLICPEMKVTAFCYYSPLLMRVALEKNRLADRCPIVPKNITEQDLKPWHGFGSGY